MVKLTKEDLEGLRAIGLPNYKKESELLREEVSYLRAMLYDIEELAYRNDASELCISIKRKIEALKNNEDYSGFSDNGELEKENELLREALVKIADLKCSEEENLINIPVTIARKALGID